MNPNRFGRGRGGGRGERAGGHYGRSQGIAYGMARSERVLDKADLQILLLELLKDGPKHGYDLIRAIKSLSEGCYAPSPGMVYPALNTMAESELVIPSSEEAGRKSFAITKAGEANLAKETEAVSAIVDRIKTLAGSQAKTRAPIARALANLDLVLANVSTEASDDQLDQIVTLIDGVARQIERLS